ncbi:MAG TPA: hypothetical protein VF796_19060, partial [Humisphaera sp.]
MSRLDHHVNVVRTKLFVEQLLSVLARAVTWAAGAVLLAVLVDRFLLAWIPPWQTALFAAVAGAAVLGAVAWAVWRRPSRRQAAVFIDDRLGLDEKFSTALYLRADADPFAAAAVRDAERTAEEVSLHKRFPVSFPAYGLVAVLAVLLAGGSFWLDRYPLFAKAPPAAPGGQAAVAPETRKQEARRILVEARTKLLEAAPEIQADTKIQARILQMNRQLNDPTARPETQIQTAAESLQQLEKKRQEVRDRNLAAIGAGDNKLLKDVAGVVLGEDSALKGLQEAMASGDVTKVLPEVEKLAQAFDNMSAEEKKKAAEDMNSIAEKLAEQAKKPDASPEDQQKAKDLADAAKQLADAMKQQAAAPPPPQP